MMQDCGLSSRASTSIVPFLVAGTAFLSVHMMQDCGLSSKAMTSRVLFLV
jgi:hypothetical protein